MQISLQMKVLLSAAAAVTAYVIFAPTDEQTVDVARVGDQATRAPRAAQHAGHRRDPVRTLYSLTHRVSAGDAADALFAIHSWYTPPPPPPPTPEPKLTAAQETALRVPTAPPLPFAYMGSYTLDGSDSVFFLTKGDRVYDVKVGDILDGIYSIDAAGNGRLSLTYKPLQIQQQLIIGSAQ
jgi:hypothetical protein